MYILKNILDNRFESLKYFYKYLKGKVFVSIGLNVLIGLLDGLGLSMFLPLMQIAGSPEAGKTPVNSDLSYLVDLFKSAGITLNLQVTLLFIVVFFILKGIVYYFKGVYQVKLQQNFVKNLRLENIQNLVDLKYEYFVKSDLGRIQNTLTGETEKVSKACQSYFVSIQCIVLVTVYIVFAFTLNWKFAFLVCIGGAVTDLIYRKIYRNTKGISKKITADSSVFQNLLFQALSNYKYLKATGEIKNYKHKLTEQVGFIERNNSRVGILSVILSASREPLSIIVVCFAIMLQILVFHSTLASVLISLLFFYRALNALMQFQASWNTFLTVSGSLENVKNFNDELRLFKQRNGSIPMQKFTGNITLSNVSFGYDDKVILDDVSFEIYKNETLALVGESGSGKSTLINLICGLLPAKNGHITIDNTDISQLNLESFQEHIGLITQESVIFNDSIYNNVTLWSELSPENLLKFEKACKQAHIWDFVQSTGNGKDAQLGNNGINLSGGQRQRISIARELFKDVSILILDEATSALDAETENEIQNSIESLKGKLTLIIIAHRFSTIKSADRIAFLKNKRLASIDTFQRLLEKNTDFRNLVELQEIITKEKFSNNV